MDSRFFAPWVAAAAAAGFAACATTPPAPTYEEFVRTVNFTPFDTYAIEEVAMRAETFQWMEAGAAEKATRAALQAAFVERGFERAGGEADLLCRATWRKTRRREPSGAAPPDAENDAASGGDPGQRVFVVTVEIADAESGKTFWRSRERLVGEARADAEGIRRAVRKAMRDFPDRVEKDPDLPNLG